MVTYTRLTECDPEQFRKWGMAWSKLWVDRVDHRADDVKAARSGLAKSWEGDAYQAAAGQLGSYAGTLDDAQAPLRTIDTVLDGLADDLRKAQGMVEDALDAARLIPATVSQDGESITYTGDEKLDKERKISAGRQMRKILDDIDAAIELATRADQSAAAELAKLRPGYDPTNPGKGYVPKGEIPPPGSPPAKVRAWWASLSPEEQQYLIHEHPERIGWLDGVPISARDQANRVRLAYEHEKADARKTRLTDRKRQLEAELATYEGYGSVENNAKSNKIQAELDKVKAELGVVDRNLKGIDAIEDRLYNHPDKPRAYLIGFEPGTVDLDGNGKPDDDGKAIVAIGNPDTADHVATYVPGTGADLDGIGTDIGRADDMAFDAGRMAPGEETSVIMWLGYDAPDDAAKDAWSADYAEDAAGDLRRFQEGLRATHEGGPSHNTVVGHSYGTTVIGHTAAGDGGISADDLVFVASPGVGVDHAGSLGVSPDHVWSTTAEYDAINDVAGWHGRDPSGTSFGGNVFDSAPGDPDDRRGTHSDYWDRGNGSRTGMAGIITGNHEVVPGYTPPAPPSGPTPTPAPRPAPTPPR